MTASASELHAVVRRINPRASCAQARCAEPGAPVNAKGRGRPNAPEAVLVNLLAEDAALGGACSTRPRTALGESMNGRLKAALPPNAQRAAVTNAGDGLRNIWTRARSIRTTTSPSGPGRPRRDCCQEVDAPEAVVRHR